MPVITEQRSPGSRKNLRWFLVVGSLVLASPLSVAIYLAVSHKPLRWKHRWMIGFESPTTGHTYTESVPQGFDHQTWFTASRSGAAVRASDSWTLRLGDAAYYAVRSANPVQFPLADDDD